MALLSNDQSLNIIIKARNEASKVLGTVSKEINSFKGRVENLQPAFQKMAIGGGAAFAAVGYGMKQALDAAVDLGESANAVSVIFGEGSDAVLKFGKNSATAVGLSNAEFNQLAANTGAVLKATGKDMGVVADMTTELSVRAADMASVYNTDVQTAMNAIRSGLIGQSEPLRALGVIMTEAEVQAFALSSGIIETDRALTEQEKVLARYNFIMEQSNVVAGDFANTSDSLANQQRVLGAQFKDMQATLGAELIPVMQTVLQTIRPIIDSVAKWIGENPKLAAAIGGAVLALAGLVTVLGLIGLALPIIIGGFALLFSPIALIVGIIALSLIPVIMLLVQHWDTLKEGAITAFTNIGESILAWWGFIKAVFQGWGLELQLLGVKIGSFWTGVKNAFKEGVNFLVGVAEAWANSYVKAANTIISALNKIQVSVPDWVPGIGGKSFGVNIPLVPQVSLPRFEHGGIIPGPVGRAVPIMAHGQERVIPAGQNGRGGNVYVVHFNNPVLNSRDDIQNVRRQIELALRDVSRNHKLTTI